MFIYFDFVVAWFLLLLLLLLSTSLTSTTYRIQYCCIHYVKSKEKEYNHCNVISSKLKQQPVAISFSLLITSFHIMKLHFLFDLTHLFLTIIFFIFFFFSRLQDTRVSAAFWIWDGWGECCRTVYHNFVSPIHTIFKSMSIKKKPTEILNFSPNKTNGNATALTKHRTNFFIQEYHFYAWIIQYLTTAAAAAANTNSNTEARYIVTLSQNRNKTQFEHKNGAE